jgi:hypothetical protein
LNILLSQVAAAVGVVLAVTGLAAVVEQVVLERAHFLFLLVLR